jgi:hypothetical protein
MGQCTGGWESDSPLLDFFYSFPAPRVAHGCLLEGVALALERRFESFSQGRGLITPERIDLGDRIATRDRARPILWTGRPLAYAVSRVREKRV